MNISENIFLALSKKVQNLGFKQSLIEISKIAFEEMPIDRLTVWSFAKNKTLLICQFKMDNISHTFNCDSVLDLTKYPIYHNALLTEKIIHADDVYNSKFIFQMGDDYLRPHNICSAINVPLFVDGLLIGMVVMSTVGKYYSWKQEDLQFCSDIAEIISIAHIASKRNEDLRNLNKKAENFKSINDDLKEVIKRKNEQFIEYGFINSHLLSAPLSRLKGLMNLLVIEMDGENREVEVDLLMSKLFEEYKEMDEIVDRISEVVDKGESLDRDKFD
jgi:transcriptional regulator with GAF, ATPase, and Fis domain